MARAYQLKIIAKGDTSPAQRAMKDLKGATGRLQKAIGIDFKRIARAGGLALGVGLAASVKIGFDELKESQKVSAQTAAALKSTGGAANVTGKHIEAMGGRLQGVSGISDEVIRSGANMLLTFRNVANEAGKGNKVFDRATEAALDLSVAGFGSMESTSKMLGKALNDPVAGLTAMSRAGVTFSQSQKDSIKAMVESGNTLGAQKAILKELEAQVGGSAKAYGKTLPGQLARAKETFGDLAGNLVSVVIPSITKLGTKATDLVMRIKAWSQTAQGRAALDQARVVVDKLGNAVVVAVGIVGSFATKLYEWRDVLIPLGAGILAMVVAVKAWRIAMAALLVVQAAVNVVLAANPIGIVVLAIAGLVTALVVAYKRSDRFRAIVDSVGRFLKGVFLGAVNGVRTAIGWLGDRIQDVRNFFSSLGDRIRAVTGWVKDHKAVLLALATGPLGLVVAGIALFLTKTKSGKEILNKFKEKAVEAFETIREALQPVIDGFKEMAKWIGKGWEKLSSIAGKVGKIPGFGGGDPFMPFATGSQALLSAFGLKSVTAPAVGLATTHGLKVTSGLRPGAVTASGNPSDHRSGKAFDVSGSASSMASYYRAAKAMFGSAIKQIIYSPLDGWSSDHFDHVHVAMYGRGGVVDSPHLGIVGEAGPEAIVPLSRARRHDAARVMSEAGLGGSVKVDQHFYGDVDPFRASRDMRAAIQARVVS